MTKAVFFDIDGTILAREQGILHITTRVQAAMRNLQKAGHKIFIATGRPAGFMYDDFLNFGFDGFVFNNGALVLVGGEIIFRCDMDMARVREICEYAESERVEYILESYPEVYCPARFAACYEFFKKIGVDYSKFISEFDFDKISVSKIECVTARTDSEALDAVYKKILSTPDVTGWADPFHFKTTEVYSDKISKASGVLRVLEHFGIAVENSYAFGDGFNDIEMIQTVGTGFAMGTGRDELKRVAKYVVPSVFEDGVAVGIERYILEV
ncbi:MAG: HAD family hydrolase [Selenomonadaceae bacterium]|nr:HAD family hydrolase [Selenomonadaceae bacterium]